MAEPFASSLYPGKVTCGWEVRQKDRIEELDVTVLRLKHIRSGANFVHLLRDDPNSVFAIGFKTVPLNSTGVAHILEHCTLCGSDKYPVRDPFFKMLSRSLATYMNAYTAADHTLYPFASENWEDYRNLRDIYFDACFHPLLREVDFRQEGWRLEASNSNYGLKGVVLNEMKGALSDADTLFGEHIQRRLFAGTTYAENSGGDPQHIPKLSYASLMDFYNRHYHPTNALFLSYGTLIEDNMVYLDERLSSFTEGKGVNPDITNLAEIKTPIIDTVVGPHDPMGSSDKQYRFALAWRCSHVNRLQESFHLQLLSNLLLDGPSAPLFQALIESGLGSEWSAGTGLDTSTIISSFGVGVNGASESDLSKIQPVIFDTLTSIRSTRIPTSRIDSALHQIDLALRYKSASFGLRLVSSAMSGWAHGIHPTDQLSISGKIEELKKRLARRRPVLEHLIRKYMLENPARLELTMRPSADYNERLAHGEACLAQELVNGMSEEQKSILDASNVALLTSQNQSDNVESLPMLKTSDIPLQLKKPNLPFTLFGAIERFYQRQTLLANGITYQRFLKVIPADTLSNLDPRLLPLAVSMFTEFGVAGRPFAEFEEDVKGTCGGLDVSFFLDRSENLRILFSMHSLDDRRDAVLDLFQSALTKTDYKNINRLRTHIAGTAASMSSAIASSGHRFALSAAASRIGGRFVLTDAFNGLQQAKFMEELSRKDDLSNVVEQIKVIHSQLLCIQGEWRAAIISVDDYRDGPLKFIRSISKRPFVDTQSTYHCDVQQEYEQVIPAPINTSFAAAALHLPNIQSIPHKAALMLSTELLRSKYLHKEIREKGGAYGASASFNHLDGLYSFHSYRDPSPERSLTIFSGSFKFIAEYDINQQSLEEAKLAVIASIDAPVDLGNEGLAEFKLDLTDTERSELRSAILQTDPSTIQNVIKPLVDCNLSSCILRGSS